MSGTDYPLALSIASPGFVRDCTVHRKVGKFIAGARSEASFERFQELVSQAAARALTNPLRLLILPHLRNSIGQLIPGLNQGSRVLIEGFLFELLLRGRLVRLSTINKDFEPYQTILPAETRQLVEAAIESLAVRLATRGAMSIDDVSRAMPVELSAWRQNAQVLLGHLLYRGTATTDAAPGAGIDLIRVPNAAPRL